MSIIILHFHLEIYKNLSKILLIFTFKPFKGNMTGTFFNNFIFPRTKFSPPLPKLNDYKHNNYLHEF